MNALKKLFAGIPAIKTKSGLIFLFITLLIDFIGFGITIPIIPKLILELTSEGIGKAVIYGGMLSLCYSLAQFICAPILGALSDRFGRRPVLLASLFGLGMDYIFLSMAGSIFWLFVGRIIAGITGASYATAQAYVSDVSTPENKIKNFGLIGAAFGIGIIIGPLIGGIFSQFGVRIPFIIAAFLSLLNCLYGYFTFPESLPIRKRRRLNWKRANAIGSLLYIRKYPSIHSLLFILFLIFLASHSVQVIWSYYNIEKFQWNEVTIGYSLFFFGLIMCVVQAGLLKYVVKKLGRVFSILVGLAIYTLGYILFAFASKSWMIFVFIIPHCIAGICGPAIQAVISDEIPSYEQGEMQSIISCISSMASIIGPIIMSAIFYKYINPSSVVYFPGAPFVLSALLTSLALILCLRVFNKSKKVKDL